jgi:predicted ribosome quality control (RQC) complex YloA/Tae2 family protein
VHQETLKEVVAELAELLPGRFLGRIFQLSDLSLAIDFGFRTDGFLFISVEPAAPRLYLIKRSVRELENASSPPSGFAQLLRARLNGASVVSITKDESERIVRIPFLLADELGDSGAYDLAVQLTGRSANIFLLNSSGEIIQALRTLRGEGQQPGEQYEPPTLRVEAVSSADANAGPATLLVARGESASISAALDKHYRSLESIREFDNLAAKLSAKLRKEMVKREKLRANLKKDLLAHGNPEEHKRLGDLLLANIANAKRDGNSVSLTDYYAEGAPLIEIEVDEDVTLQDAAGKSFSRYTKAKRAVEEIGTRLQQLERELTGLEEKRLKLEQAIANRDPGALAEFEETRAKPARERKKQKASLAIPGMRRYLSSDGYEVFVGRTARDNDQLTFRVARPNDLWLHAGDYPGSHVIVRNSSRNEIPHRTILEAAQLAAKFSQASKDSKVAIHYTRRKFLSKPKGAAPGLVRLSTFKTITVEPGENLVRVNRRS